GPRRKSERGASLGNVRTSSRRSRSPIYPLQVVATRQDCTDFPKVAILPVASQTEWGMSVPEPARSKVTGSSSVPVRRERGRSSSRPTRRLAAVAFVDVVGYTILMSSDESRTHIRWMKILDEVIHPRTTEYGGRIVKSTGDGILAEFSSALDAV